MGDSFVVHQIVLNLRPTIKTGTGVGVVREKEAGEMPEQIRTAIQAAPPPIPAYPVSVEGGGADAVEAGTMSIAAIGQIGMLRSLKSNQAMTTPKVPPIPILTETTMTASVTDHRVVAAVAVPFPSLPLDAVHESPTSRRITGTPSKTTMSLI